VTLFTAIVMIAVGGATAVEDATYRATTRIRVIPPTRNIVESPELSALVAHWSRYDREVEFATLVKILRSRPVRQAAADRLSGEPEPPSAARLGAGLQVSASLDTQIISISVDDADPELAAKLADAVAAAFAQHQRAAAERESASLRETLDAREAAFIAEQARPVSQGGGAAAALRQRAQAAREAAFFSAVSRLREADLIRATRAESITVIEPARVPPSPHGSSPGIRVLLGALLGLLVGAAAAAAREALDVRVDDADDVLDAGLIWLGDLPGGSRRAGALAALAAVFKGRSVLLWGLDDPAAPLAGELSEVGAVVRAAGTDAEALSAAAPIVLVASAGQTRLEALRRARLRLEAAGGTILGVALVEPT